MKRLHHAKSHLNISMVSAELKHITQFEELQLLKEFGKRETTYTTRYRAKKKERKDIEEKVRSNNFTNTPGTKFQTLMLYNNYVIYVHTIQYIRVYQAHPYS